jgi:Sec-independent protein translocase protein TatA
VYLFWSRGPFYSFESLELVKFSLKYSVADRQARAMPARGSRTLGPSRIPVTASNPERELRMVTRGMNGISKRKRPEIESSETESTASDNVKHLEHRDKIATSLSELTALVTALKEAIKKQTNIIENA